MAFHNQILLFLSLSFLVFQFNIATPTSAPTPTPGPTSSQTQIDTSHISLSPKGEQDPAHNYVDSLMQAEIAKTEEFLNNVVNKRLADAAAAADPFVKDCLLVCKEVYENGVDAMKKTMEDMENGAYYSANVDLSAISTDLGTCMDCVKEIYGIDQEFMKFDEWAEQVTSDALDKVVEVSS
ncbi:unnamed protein product [Withania somnifera]